MPDNLSALVAGAGTQQPEMPQNTTGKKLKKVGKVYTDGEGNYYADEYGGVPFPSQAAAESALSKKGQQGQGGMSTMDGGGKPQQTSAMDSPQTGIQKAMKSYTSGAYQDSYDTLVEAMKDPTVAQDPQVKMLMARLRVKLNLQ